MLKGKRLLDKCRPYAKKMGALSHEYRVAVLYILAYGDQSAGDIATLLNISKNLASFHLKQLHTTGWILRTRKGKTIVYQLNKHAFVGFEEILSGTPLEKTKLSQYKK